MIASVLLRSPWAMLLLLVAGALISAAITATVRTWGREKGLLDLPNHRSSHERPVVRGGGAGVAIVVTLGAWLVWLLEGAPAEWAKLVSLLGFGGAVIAALGWLDDVAQLPSALRLVVQAAVAAIVAFTAGPEFSIDLFGASFTLGPVTGTLLAVVWIVGVTNIYNFMDGIDGIAGIQGVVGGLVWFGAGLVLGEPMIAAVGILLSAACIGFLRFNWAPATIFMGDVGSTFLGFVFATLPLATLRADARLLEVGFLAIAPFLIDGTFTLLRRLRNRENVFRAHRSHIYQRLVIAGLRHSTVSSAYGLLAAATGALALARLGDRVPASFVILSVPVVLVVLLAAVRAAGSNAGPGRSSS